MAMEMTDELVQEIAAMDMVCDKCVEEVKEGTPYYADMINAKVYCPNCVA
jgi:late competence protein required for DNA uptake (superfamily II DNA/RNA helicase)